MSRHLAVLILLLVVLLPVLDGKVDGAGDQVGRPAGPVDVAQPALLPPPPSPTIEPYRRDAVYGGFLLAGNSVLRCPVGEETPGDNPAEECAAATEGGPSSGGALLDNSGNNNGYYLRLADGDERADTFTSSSAEVTIPAGASVRYAQLTWGGHTGRFLGFSGVNCVRPLLLHGEAPPPPAAPTPAEQPVEIAVAGREPTLVRREQSHFRRTDGLDEPSQIYTDWADVTSAFTGALPTGSPIEVTVSNVWAPTGPGCAGGWSITVVFDHGQPTERYPRPRVVDVYNDELPRTGALLPGLIEPLLPGVPEVVDVVLPGLVPAITGTNVVLPGPTRFRSTADPVVGLTAFDGDWKQGGETFTVDGTAVTEPCVGDRAEDFFRSCAAGAVGVLDPARRPLNNLSVDAKTVRPTLPDNDTGDVEVGLHSVGDFLVLASVVLAESVDPTVAITMSGPAEPVDQGSLVSYAVEIRNDGGLPLTDVTLTADDGTVCTPARLPDLRPGAAVPVSCVRPAHEPGTLSTSATVTARYLTGDTGATVSATATASVEVVPADYTVVRMPDRLVARAGEPVTFAVELRNNTAEDLTGMVYADDVAECPEQPDVLPAHGILEFVCTATAPDTAFESGGTMRGVGPVGELVTVSSDRVLIAVITPSIAVVTAVSADTLYAGVPVELTFTVTNPGTDRNETLTDVRVSTELCVPEPLPTLAPGEEATVSCVARPDESRDVVATATGFDVTGGEVTTTAVPVPITVLEPLIELSQQVDRAVARVGDEVTITFTVTHVGEAFEDTNEVAGAPVRDIRISSPTLPPTCQVAPVDQLEPGESATGTCVATPDRTFDNQAFATAVDAVGRPMRVGTTPLRVTVINPALVLSVTAEPESAPHGAAVDFAVLVRNIGDVPMTVDVANDRAGDCDFAMTGDGLPAGAASGVRCTVVTPTSDSATELTNTAAYTADPLERTGDTGPSLHGTDTATVALTAGQAAPRPPAGADPVTQPGGNTGTGGSTGSGDGGGYAGGNGGGDLAWTGVSLALPVGLGISLLVLGGLTLMVTSRRRHDENSVLYRWWPGD